MPFDTVGYDHVHDLQATAAWHPPAARANARAGAGQRVPVTRSITCPHLMQTDFTISCECMQYQSQGTVGTLWAGPGAAHGSQAPPSPFAFHLCAATSHTHKDPPRARPAATRHPHLAPGRRVLHLRGRPGHGRGGGQEGALWSWSVPRAVSAGGTVGGGSCDAHDLQHRMPLDAKPLLAGWQPLAPRARTCPRARPPHTAACMCAWLSRYIRPPTTKHTHLHAHTHTHTLARTQTETGASTLPLSPLPGHCPPPPKKASLTHVQQQQRQAARQPLLTPPTSARALHTYTRRCKEGICTSAHQSQSLRYAQACAPHAQRQACTAPHLRHLVLLQLQQRQLTRHPDELDVGGRQAKVGAHLARHPIEPRMGGEAAGQSQEGGAAGQGQGVWEVSGMWAWGWGWGWGGGLDGVASQGGVDSCSAGAAAPGGGERGSGRATPEGTHPWPLYM